MFLSSCHDISMNASNRFAAAEVALRIRELVQELPDLRADAARLDELRRLFARVEASGDLELGVASAENKAASKWRSFLLKHHKMMVSQLCQRIADGRHSSIRCLFGVIAASPVNSKNSIDKFLNPDLLEKWFQAMTFTSAEEMDKGMKHMVESEFIRPYRDVQYYALGSIARLASAEYNRSGGSSPSRMGEKLLQFLMMIPLTHSSKEFESGKLLFPPQRGAMIDETQLGEDEECGSRVTDEHTAESGSDADNEGSAAASRPLKRQKRESQRPALQRLKRFRREYERAWLAILKLPLPVASLKQALQFLPDRVLDYVPNPLRFCDFFMQAYSDHGQGVIGIFALDGLFLLITQHGLEYPDFYNQLYRLVTPRAMYAKYRERFFSLLTRCLMRNEMLPAHLVAAFAKRLCRCALSAPPSGALFILALVSNLLRKHSECSSLIQRGEGEETEDLYLATENEPTSSKGLNTSLWELMALERHYYPAVGTIARSLGSIEESKSPFHDMDEFSCYTYKSLFDMERKKKTRSALTFTEPQSLFGKNDIFSQIMTSPNESEMPAKDG